MFEESRRVSDPKEAQDMSENAQEIAKTALSKAIRRAYEAGITKEQIDEITKWEKLPDNVN